MVLVRLALSRNRYFKDRSRLNGLLDRDRLALLNGGSIGDWIETNTCRVHVFIPATLSGFVLGLMEGFVECRFNPLLEGKPPEI